MDLCAVCGTRLTPVYQGQRLHPLCDPWLDPANTHPDGATAWRDQVLARLGEHQQRIARRVHDTAGEQR